MKTDYFAHEDIYQKKREKGQAGWDPEEISLEVWRQFESLMGNPLLPGKGPLLELGCGAGNLSIGFARLGYQVTGVDISPTAVAWAKERAAKEKLSIDLSVADVLELGDLGDASFAVVVDSHCFHCIVGPDRKRFLSNAKRLLEPGGSLILNCMVQNDRTSELEGFVEETGILWRGDIATRCISTLSSIEVELAQAGFVCLESRVEAEDEPADSLLLIAQHSP